MRNTWVRTLRRSPTLEHCRFFLDAPYLESYYVGFITGPADEIEAYINLNPSLEGACVVTEEYGASYSNV